MNYDASDIIIFGGAGDLALRKLLPAIYRIYREDSFSTDSSSVVLTCRSEEEASGLLEEIKKHLQINLAPDEYTESAWAAFSSTVRSVVLNIAEHNEQWAELAEQLNQNPERVRVFYMAIPPAIYGACCENLSKENLITDNTRLVVEKPIGYDTESAIAINNKMAEYFKEDQLYRIDHYLGKETVQNLLALRFNNLLFEELWDAKSIDHVQISISEMVGLEKRASFYDGAGAMRDMVQNHLLQLLCLIAMEPPHKLNASSIRQEKLKVLQSLRPIFDDEVLKNTTRGQYVAGEVSGELKSGYLEELGKPSSSTETFVAIRAHIDNWRWSRVPFYLRTGKRMNKRSAEIVVQFKDVSHRLYPKEAGALQANKLVIRLQPDESMQLVLMAKNLQKLETELQPVTLNLNFADASEEFRSDAYKRLLLDVVEGNPSLFIHRDEVEQAWHWCDPIMKAWRASKRQPHLYRSGTWGPEASDELLAEQGHQWFNLAEIDKAAR
jgi:glucose-6-phosphate 1-dehydrogenase